MKLRIYLDTSVISAYVDDRLPERMGATIDFWGRLPEYEVCISELAVAEVRATREADRRQQMEDLIRPFEVLVVEEGSRRLAQEYVRRGVFSPATIEDALHVAIAVVHRQDILVSWNFRHLVNRRRRALINEVNILAGYPTIEIVFAAGAVRRASMMFDYVAAAERVGISAEDLARLTAMMRAEFPSDEMMAKLHILRAILSVERGDATLEEILGQRAAA